jgi:branched-chain amino acid transport system permease protein
MEFFIQILVNGLSIGFLYALAALGFVMIFKSSSVLNFAHGELLAIGAFFFLVLSASAKLPIWLCFVLTLVGCFSLGFLIERFFLRPLIGEALIEVIMLTVGLSVMFKGLMLFAFGGNFFKYPSILPEVLAVDWGMIHVPSAYVSSFIIGLLCLGVFGLFFKYSSQGIYMRSVADHQIAALSLGVHVRRVLALSWAIAAVVAARPMAGGIIIGLLETFTGGYISGSLGEVIPYIILVIILMIKPYGLFGSVEIERV